MISQGSGRRNESPSFESNQREVKPRKINGNHYSPSSSSHSSLFIPQPINPDTFSPSFDIIWAINNNKEQHIGDKNLSLYNYPPVVKINIDRLKPHLKGSPGVNPILSACLYGGISYLSSHEGVRELIELKLRFDSAPRGIPGAVSLALENFLANFSIDTPKGKKLNIFIPPEHSAMVSRIAGDLGTGVSNLATLAILITLKEQKHTNRDGKEEMERVIERFFNAVSVRVRGARALMNEFQIPELREKEKEGEKKK